jgi:DNA uptake protein ComE-like DNA-binding protein
MMKWSTILAASTLAAFAACSGDSAKTADTTVAMGDTSAAMTMPAATDAAAPAVTSAAGGMMDPNSASAADLATIPGVTPVIASEIAEGRPYATNVALDKVLKSRLKEQQRDSVYSRLWTKIDLNTATDEEILLIPGIGARMLHEFKEYRPYTSMDQFRREMGKYVDNAEVARMERFVMIK